MVVKNIKKRLFIVGTPRSGTTLLQSLLAAHPDIYSFPETHFFSKTMPMRRSMRLLWQIQKKDINHIISFLKEIHKEKFIDYVIQQFPKGFSTIRHWSKQLIFLLDAITLDEGYNIWLEKTPAHLRYISVIESTKLPVEFIHIIRDGKDVVASLYDVTHRFPEIWGKPRSIDNCINRWKLEVSISRKYVGKSNHHFIFYEELVEHPKEKIQRLCEKLNIGYSDNIIEDYKHAAGKLIVKNETWKENTNKEIKPRSKFEKVFTFEQREYILSQLSKFEWRKSFEKVKI